MSLPLLERQIDAYLVWYHEHRPHQGLDGRTPREALDEHGRPQRRRRARAPPKRGKLRPLRLVVSHLEGRRHLPIVALVRARAA